MVSDLIVIVVRVKVQLAVGADIEGLEGSEKSQEKGTSKVSFQGCKRVIWGNQRRELPAVGEEMGAWREDLRKGNSGGEQMPGNESLVGLYSRRIESHGGVVFYHLYYIVNSLKHRV